MHYLTDKVATADTCDSIGLVFLLANEQQHVLKRAAGWKISITLFNPNSVHIPNLYHENNQQNIKELRCSFLLKGHIETFHQQAQTLAPPLNVQRITTSQKSTAQKL